MILLWDSASVAESQLRNLPSWLNPRAMICLSLSPKGISQASGNVRRSFYVLGISEIWEIFLCMRDDSICDWNIRDINFKISSSSWRSCAAHPLASDWAMSNHCNLVCEAMVSLLVPVWSSMITMPVERGCSARQPRSLVNNKPNPVAASVGLEYWKCLLQGLCFSAFQQFKKYSCQLKGSRPNNSQAKQLQ